MLYLIDANSLINLYRYIYRVSDSKEDISRFFDEKVENGQVIILESIHEEAIRHESLLFSEMIPILESDPHLLEKSEMYPHERVTSDLSSVLLTDSGKRYKRNKTTILFIFKGVVLKKVFFLFTLRRDATKAGFHTYSSPEKF